jgi:hypothetical protein
VFLFPFLIKFAAALAIFWLISPRGKLTTPLRWARRVAASFLVVIVIAFPFVSYSGPEWKVALFMGAAAWALGFVLGGIVGYFVLRYRKP